MASRTLTVTDNMTERQRNAFASPITIWEDYTVNPWPFRRVCRWRRDSTRYLAAHHVIPRNEGGADHPANLEALCVQCHGRESAAERRSEHY
jgi:5-methylcytosine-specific restriction endonuclease McrA